MAASVIGALRVNLGLDSAKFESGARRVQKPLATMKKQLLAVVGVATAVGGALSAMAIKGANDVDRAAKASRRLGSSVGGYRALELAAGEAGVSVSTLADQVQSMDREVSRGGKNAVAALDRLGVSAGELQTLEADEKLALISDRVKSLGLNSGQASALLQDLGVRNREMVLAILAGGDVFRSARSDIEDYGLAISQTNSEAIEEANDRIGRLGLISQYAGQQLAISLVPTMGLVAQAMTDSLREGGFLRGMIDGLVGNIDVLVNTLSVAVAGFGVRYVGALALAKIATFSLSGALVALRGAIIATGIGALIVGAGLAVTYFTRLSTAAGGFGNAMGLLGDVVKEVWGRIKLGFMSMEFALAAGWLNTKARAIEALGGIVEVALNTVNSIVGGFVGAYDAVVAAWSALPDAFARFGSLAVNKLIDSIGAGIGGVLSPLNSILEKFGGTPIAPPSLEGWKVTVGDAADVGGKVRAAFDDAFNENYVGGGGIVGGLKSRTSELKEAGKATAELGSFFKDAATAPLGSLKTLKDTISETADETVSATTAARELKEALGDAEANGGGSSGGGASKSIGGITKAVEGLKEGLSSVRDSVKEAFSDIVFESKNVGDAIGSLLKKFGKLAFDSGFDNLFKVGSDFLGGLLGGSKGGGGFLKKLLSFEGGGSTGVGPRAGGLDGKGGFLAMVHPNETYIDHAKNGGLSSSANGAGIDVSVRVGVDQSGSLQAYVEGVSRRNIASNNAERDQSFGGKVNATQAGTHRRTR